MSNSRLGFSSKLGGLLAAAGSAIGVGNMWRFPTQLGQNGGSAFLLVYFLIIFVFGVPLLISEFAIGRHSKANVGNAYTVLAPNSFWKYIGIASVTVAFVIFCYYNVVVAWVLFYAVDAVSTTFIQLGNSITPDNPNPFANHFTSFIANPWKPILCLFFVLAMIHTVIVLGVQKGIERTCKLLMPTLLILMICLAAYAVTMPGAKQAYQFLFSPKFEEIDANVIVSALGQCFYSFSIGMGIVTYASYFRRDVNIEKTAISVGLIDTFVAILAGLVIFPAVFSVAGVSPSEGASLVFVSLPNVFHSALHHMPFLSWLVSTAFYVILFLAAITSCIFLHEVATAFVYERTGLSRKKAATIITVGAFSIGCVASLSMGPWSEYSVQSIFSLGEWANNTFLAMNFFDFLDYVTAKIVLPLTGLGAALFVGYGMTTHQLWYELTAQNRYKFRWLHPFLFLVKYVIPVLIIGLMLIQLLEIKF